MENDKEITDSRTKEHIPSPKRKSMSKDNTDQNKTNNNKPRASVRNSKVNFEKKIEVVKVESYKQYNLENAFEEPGGKPGGKPQQYHCKCIIS
jgi:hypothetical protein